MDKPKEDEAKEAVAEEKPKSRSSQPKEPAPAFMSNVFAALDVYKNKMLVSPGPDVQENVLALKVENSVSEFLFFFFQNYLARNFYNLRFLALFVCFAINFILLFYKVKPSLPQYSVSMFP